MTKHVLFSLAILMAVVTLLVGCTDTAPQQKGSTEINILCVTEPLCNAAKQEFEKKFGITVNYVRLSAGEIVTRLQTEKANPQFDIWYGGSAEGFIGAKQEGLLETYDSPNFKNLADPQRYKDKDNQWGGISVGTLAFCTNTTWLAKNPKATAPKSWDDLLKPEFKKQIMMAHPSTSGTSYAVLATILQTRGEKAGWEFIQKLGGQVAQYTRPGGTVSQFVGRGEAAVGIVFSHDLLIEMDDNKAPLTMTFPEEGTGYEIGTQAIIKGAKHMDAAKKFFDWALTPEMQMLYPNHKIYQAPTVKGAKISHPELIQVKLVNYDFLWAGTNKKGIVDKFTKEVAPADNLKQ